MEQGERGEQDVVRPKLPRFGQPPSSPDVIPLRENAAFGKPRGPRGVVDRHDRVPVRERSTARLHAQAEFAVGERFRDTVGHVDRIVEEHDPLEIRKPVEQRFARPVSGLVDDQRGSFRVAQLVPKEFALQERIERHLHRPDAGTGEVQLEDLGPIRRQDRHSLARTHSGGEQAGADLLGTRPHVAVRHRFAATAEEHPLGGVGPALVEKFRDQGPTPGG
jgi:hypothetical protein